jgi:predicted small metal-binding protein
MKSFSCRDVGVDCNWTCKASSEQEVLRLAESHAKKEHPNVQFDDALKNKIRQKIKDVKAA